MADDVMALDERLARLEVTVANGFSEQSGRITSLEQKVDTLEQKFDALNNKLDVVSESLEDKMQLVLERLDSRTKEMLAATESMRREWRADRRLMYAMLKDHRIRIEAPDAVRTFTTLLAAPAAARAPGSARLPRVARRTSPTRCR